MPRSKKSSPPKLLKRSVNKSVNRMVEDLPGADIRRSAREIRRRSENYERRVKAYSSELKKYNLTKEEYEKRLKEYKQTYGSYVKPATRGRAVFVSSRPLGQRVLKKKYKGYKKASKELSAQQKQLKEKRTELVSTQKALAGERKAIKEKISSYHKKLAEYEKHQRDLQEAYGVSLSGDAGMEVTTASGSKYIYNKDYELIGVEDALTGQSRLATGGDMLYSKSVIKPQLETSQSIYVPPPTEEEIKAAHIPQKTYFDDPPKSDFINLHGEGIISLPTPEKDRTPPKIKAAVTAGASMTGVPAVSYFFPTKLEARTAEQVKQDYYSFRYGGQAGADYVVDKYVVPALFLASGAAGVGTATTGALAGQAVGGFSLGGAIGAGAGVASIPMLQAAYAPTNIELAGKPYKDLTLQQKTVKFLGSEQGRNIQTFALAGGVSYGLSRVKTSFSVDTSKIKTSFKPGSKTEFTIDPGSYVTSTSRYPFRSIQTETQVAGVTGSGYTFPGDKGTTYSFANVDYTIGYTKTGEPIVRSGKLFSQADPITGMKKTYSSISFGELFGKKPSAFMEYFATRDRGKSKYFVGRDIIKETGKISYPSGTGGTEVITEYSSVGLGTQTKPYKPMFTDFIDDTIYWKQTGKPSLKFGQTYARETIPPPKITRIAGGGAAITGQVQDFSYLKSTPATTETFKTMTESVFTPTASGSSLTPTAFIAVKPIGRASDYLTPSPYAGTGKYELQSGAAPVITGATVRDTKIDVKPYSPKFDMKFGAMIKTGSDIRQDMKIRQKTRQPTKLGQGTLITPTTTTGTRSKYEVIPSYSTATATTTKTKQTQRTTQGTKLGYSFATPPLPPPPPGFGWFGLPPINFGIKGKARRRKTKKSRKGKRKSARKPSLTALGFPAVKVKPQKMYTGFEIRRVKI
jgi:hypothetical protein